MNNTNGFPPGKSFYDEWDLPPPPPMPVVGVCQCARSGDLSEGIGVGERDGRRNGNAGRDGWRARAPAKRVPANCELDARAGQHKFDQTDAFSGITNNPVQYSLFSLPVHRSTGPCSLPSLISQPYLTHHWRPSFYPLVAMNAFIYKRI